MTDPDLTKELARRAGVSHADAEAMLSILAELAPAGVGKTPSVVARAARKVDVWAASTSTESGTMAFLPSAGAVEELIAAAERHPLGLEFLLDGELGAVAATFQTHAFTVDAARDRLRRHPR
jgi:hypothetical protein